MAAVGLRRRRGAGNLDETWPPPWAPCALSGFRFAGSVSVLDRVQAPFVRHSFEDMSTLFGQGDAGADQMALHGFGHEDLTGAGKITDPLRDADREADDVVRPDLELTGMDAGAHLKADTPCSGCDLCRGAHGPVVASKVARNPSPVVLISRPR